VDWVSGTGWQRGLGAILIILSIVASVTGDYRFQLAGIIFALAGVGLRIEAAIRVRNVR
jgi:hypothetical protein